jgi:hypothetical protein
MVSSVAHSDELQELKLSFEQLTTPVGESVLADELVNEGSAPVAIRPVDNRRPGAHVTSGTDPVEGRYVQFPGGEGRTAPEAILSIQPQAVNGSDPLSPGLSSFSFGDDFRYDGSFGATSGKGNNILQRGLYGGQQFKLQADAGHLTCRIAGSQSAVVVPPLKTRTPLVLQPGAWYRGACDVQRISDGSSSVVVTVTLTTRDSGVTQTRTSRQVQIGQVAPSSAPVEVGGKPPKYSSSNDQFEGAVDNVFVDVR